MPEIPPEKDDVESVHLDVGLNVDPSDDEKVDELDDMYDRPKMLTTPGNLIDFPGRTDVALPSPKNQNHNQDPSQNLDQNQSQIQVAMDGAEASSPIVDGNPTTTNGMEFERDDDVETKEEQQSADADVSDVHLKRVSNIDNNVIGAEKKEQQSDEYLTVGGGVTVNA